jgi:dolichol-phosphate mannosyltransferase
MGHPARSRRDTTTPAVRLGQLKVAPLAARALPYAPRHRSLVILPTYNEVGNLDEMMQAIAGNLVADVLVVDDNSPDGTGELADDLARRNPRVHVLHRPAKQGLGPAYLAGFRWGLARGFERLIEMDCDFSHAPSALPALVQGCADADLVLGSRYVEGGGTVGWNVLRRFVSKAANTYSRVILGPGVRDWTGGFRCYTADILRRVQPRSATANGYTFQVQMAWLVRRAGGSIVEMPIQFTERRRGKSKMTLGIALEAVFAIPLLRLRSWSRMDHVGGDPEVAGDGPPDGTGGAPVE